MKNPNIVLIVKPKLDKKSVGQWLIRDEQPTEAGNGLQLNLLDPFTTHALVEYLGQQLCKSGDPSLQRKAALELAQIGLPAVDTLVYALYQKCKTCQTMAAYALRKMGSIAIKPLLQVLDTCPATVRQKLIWVLYSIGDEQVINALIMHLKDRDRKVRRYAAWGLGHMKNPAAIPALVVALNDSYEKMRFDSGMALVKFGDKAVEAILDTLYHGKSRARSQAVAILAWLQDDKALDELIEALQDKDPHVRAQAALALGWIGNLRGVAPLINALFDNEPEVRMQAAVALGWLGDTRAIDGLVGLLQDEDYGVLYSAADAMRHITDLRATVTLTRARRGSNPCVRRASQKALQELGYLVN